MSKWQPIETAPTDGTFVWCYANGEQFSARWLDECPSAPDDYGHDAGWSSKCGWCAPGNSGLRPEYQWPPLNQPTHWMPLPEPPERQP